MKSRRTSILDRIAVICQLLVQGRPLIAQGTTETKENNSSSRQSCLDQNINNSRQRDDVLIALTSSQCKSVKEKNISRQSNESQNFNCGRNYGDLPALSPGEIPWAQGTNETEENSSRARRQSCLDQNIYNSRQNDDVLIALTSSQGQSIKKKKLPVLSSGGSSRAQGTTTTEHNSRSSRTR